MIQRQCNRVTTFCAFHVEFVFSANFLYEPIYSNDVLYVSGNPFLTWLVKFVLTKLDSLPSRGVYHSQISLSWNLQSFMSDWRESTICCKCRHWMRWSSSSLLRQMAEVCVGSDTEVLLGIWVKITLFSSSRKTSIRSSPQPVPSLIEKLGGNMKEFQLEFLHVKRNRDIKMARSFDSDHPSLSKRPS